MITTVHCTVLHAMEPRDAVPDFNKDNVKSKMKKKKTTTSVYLCTCSLPPRERELALYPSQPFVQYPLRRTRHVTVKHVFTFTPHGASSLHHNPQTLLLLLCPARQAEHCLSECTPPSHHQADDEQNGVVLEELCNEFAPNYPYSSYSVNDENHSHRAGELTWSEYPCIVHPAAPQGHVTDDALGDGTLYCSLPHVPGGHQSPGPGRGRTPLQEGTGKPAWKSR